MTSENPKLKWNGTVAKGEKESGYKVRISVDFRLTKLFPGTKEAKIAAEKVLKTYCEKALEQLDPD